jgi:hypothetical protein
VPDDQLTALAADFYYTLQVKYIYFFGGIFPLIGCHLVHPCITCICFKMQKSEIYHEFGNLLRPMDDCTHRTLSRLYYYATDTDKVDSTLQDIHIETINYFIELATDVYSFWLGSR